MNAKITEEINKQAALQGMFLRNIDILKYNDHGRHFDALIKNVNNVVQYINESAEHIILQYMLTIPKLPGSIASLIFDISNDLITVNLVTDNIEKKEKTVTKVDAEHFFIEVPCSVEVVEFIRNLKTFPMRFQDKMPETETYVFKYKTQRRVRQLISMFDDVEQEIEKTIADILSGDSNSYKSTEVSIALDNIIKDQEFQVALIKVVLQHRTLPKYREHFPTFSTTIALHDDPLFGGQDIMFSISF